MGWERYGLGTHLTTLAGSPARNPLSKTIADFKTAVVERGVGAASVAGVVMNLFISAAHAGNLHTSEVEALRDLLNTPQAKAGLEPGQADGYMAQAEQYLHKSGETVDTRFKEASAHPTPWA